MNKRILDVCCGSRMFWFNKQKPGCGSNKKIEEETFKLLIFKKLSQS